MCTVEVWCILLRLQSVKCEFIVQTLRFLRFCFGFFFCFVVSHNQLNMQPVLYSIHLFTLSKVVLRYVYIWEEKYSLCIIYIYKNSLSPDKLAGEFINPPKIFVQKKTKQKRTALVNTFKCIYTQTISRFSE